jgi:hypothetical protein
MESSFESRAALRIDARIVARSSSSGRIFGGSLLSRMVGEIPGIDIRVIADRALREEEPK